MIGVKPDLEMIFFSSYDFLYVFLYVLKFLFFAFISGLKQPLIYRLRAI